MDDKRCDCTCVSHHQPVANSGELSKLGALRRALQAVVAAAAAAASLQLPICHQVTRQVDITIPVKSPLQKVTPRAFFSFIVPMFCRASQSSTRPQQHLRQ